MARRTIQGSWLGHMWGIREDAVCGLSSVQRNVGMKAVQMKDVAGGSSTNYLGMEPFGCTLTWSVAGIASSSPLDFVRREIESWEKDIGNSGILYIGEKAWHTKPLKLVSLSVNECVPDIRGNLLSATLGATFVEYVEETARKRRKPVRYGASEVTKRKLGISSGSELGPSKAIKSNMAKKGGV